MTIKLLTKNSMGIVLTLLLVILLSESRLFKFLTDTYLGRIFLITILLVASYLNKILGIVCVFIIIIMFNNNDFSSYYEGFVEGNDTMNTSDINTASNDKKVNKTSQDTTTDLTKTTTTTTTSNNKTTPITTHTPVPNDKINVVTSSSDSSKDTKITDSITTSKAIEGFDLQSTENNIKRGKQSNSIPVNQYSRQSIEVDPYESSSFSNFFGLL
jgi:hypothetical protein